MSDANDKPRPLGFSAESLAELDRRVTAACADLDAGATYSANINLSARGRKGWLPRGVAYFLTGGLDLTIGLLDTIATRDRRITELEAELTTLRAPANPGLRVGARVTGENVGTLRVGQRVTWVAPGGACYATKQDEDVWVIDGTMGRFADCYIVGGPPVFIAHLPDGERGEVRDG